MGHVLEFTRFNPVGGAPAHPVRRRLAKTGSLKRRLPEGSPMFSDPSVQDQWERGDISTDVAFY